MREIYDHTGRWFPSIKAMCAAWGADRTKFYTRRKAGWSLEKALTGRVGQEDSTQAVFNGCRTLEEVDAVIRREMGKPESPRHAKLNALREQWITDQDMQRSKLSLAEILKTDGDIEP